MKNLIVHLIAFFRSPLMFFRSKKILRADVRPENERRVQPHKRQGYKHMTYLERKAKGLINRSHV